VVLKNEIRRDLVLMRDGYWATIAPQMSAQTELYIRQGRYD
jgi:hypothetical protein